MCALRPIPPGDCTVLIGDAPASAIDETIGYLEDLMAKVKSAMAKNPDPEAIKREVDLLKYRDCRNADRFLMANVEGMIRILKGGALSGQCVSGPLQLLFEKRSISGASRMGRNDLELTTAVRAVLHID